MTHTATAASGAVAPLMGADQRVFDDVPERQRRRMSTQRSSGTDPEIAVRRLLHARRLRYRVDHPLPGLPRRRADVVFPGALVAVFIDGCYWHGCPAHGNTPRTNTGYWAPKIARNRARDADTDRHLHDLGSAVVRAWEHEQPGVVADRVEHLVRARRSCRRGARVPATRRVG